MRKLIPVLAVLLISLPALAGSGYHAGFTGVPDICRSNLRTRPSTVAEFCFGAADGAGNIPDFSGGNLLTDRTEFDDWTESGTCAVTADQWRNPVDGAVDADYLDNTGGANGDRREITTGNIGALVGRVFTGSIWIRADYIHTCSIAVRGIGGTTTLKDVTVTHVWQRFFVTHTGTAGDTIQMRLYPGETFVSTGTAYFYGAKLVENDEFRIGMGPWINPTDQSITKPPLDLAPTNSPTNAKSDRQGSDGNRLDARRYNGIDQHDSKAAHASMDINDGDHTYTVLVEQDTGAAGDDDILAHVAAGVGGLNLGVIAAQTAYRAEYHNAATWVSVDSVATTTNDGRYHILQLVRSGNTATLYLDGVAGTPVDVTGFGLAAPAAAMLVGVGAHGWWDGQIAYFRLDAEALSDAELAYDREVLSGLASNQRTNALSVTRATTAFTEFGGGTMAEIAVNLPRVGGAGGGLLAEGQSTNLLFQSQDFSTTWTTTQATVSTDVATAPDSKTTVDGLVATAVTTQHGVAQNEIDLTADSYVLHVWARPGDQDWLYLDISTVANAYAYFNIATGFVGTAGAGIDDSGIESAWGNFYHAWIVFTGTVAQHTVCVYSAEADNDNQFLGDGSTINTYVWQAQWEKGTFPSSIIPTTTTAATRNADSITLDPHPVGKPEARALPEKFEPNTNRDKITLYGEWKAEWSSVADIGTDRRLVGIGDASSANNNFELYVPSANGRIVFRFQDDGGTVRNIQSAVHTFYNNWFSVRVVVDFTDLSRSELYVNGVVDHALDSNMTGTATFDTTDNLLRIGADRAGGVNGFHWTTELRVNNQEIRP